MEKEFLFQLMHQIHNFILGFLNFTTDVTNKQDCPCPKTMTQLSKDENLIF